ncbi:MAG: anaerobic glycerol-3-phosphate dehydrogenase subunit A [Bacteroidales bacterium]|nr:anaerobic glycerol-3-phosphate dehydrogenase subunit A [Bacteroidales bacterium]
MKKEYDVIIVGGGITGACTVRDCAMRGLRSLLIEREDLCDGASGRNHGLLHSGARYAVSDQEGARECIRENLILKKIASNCVESTGGLFISLPEDGLEWQANFVAKCHEAGIDAKILDPEKVKRDYPAVNQSIIGAVSVPDASVDPFRLTDANVLDAVRHGADILRFTEVVDFVQENGRVTGVKVRGKGGEESIHSRTVVLAAGIWASKLAEKIGVRISMLPSKGSLLVFGHRVADVVINRCRKPSNADIIVPDDMVSVLGTTSDKVPFEACDDMRVTQEEVDILLKEGVELVPALANTRIIRAYAGVRPLVSEGGDGRSVSRGIVLLDHEERDGVPGLITITGGKLTTARLMGEMTADLVCKKLGVKAVCHTAEVPLAGSEKPGRGERSYEMKSAVWRHGTETSIMDFKGPGSELVCECEQVTRAEISYSIKEFGVRDLRDLRRHTRLGMGTCQSNHCVRRAAEILAEELGCPEKAEEFVQQYLQERWKGMTPVLWGDTLREAEFMRNRYGRKDYEI